MNTHDLRVRAEWLRAVSARLPSNDVAATLAEYADEMVQKADRLEAYGQPSGSRTLFRGHA